MRGKEVIGMVGKESSNLEVLKPLNRKTSN